MSLSRPAHRAWATITRHKRPHANRHFHCLHQLQAGHKPKHPSIKASDLGLIKNEAIQKLQPYSAEQKKQLAAKYTPEQIAAIEAGESAISPEDLYEQGTARTDTMALQYLDDFATVHPLVDKQIKAPESNYDPNLRFKEDDEIAEDLGKFIENAPEEATELDWTKFDEEQRLTVGLEAAERDDPSSLAPTIPKFMHAGIHYQAGGDDDDGDNNEHTQRLMRQTGLDKRAIRRIRVKNLVTHRVVNQTRLGKVSSIYYLTVAGNGNGLVGIGEGKAIEFEDGRRQASNGAIRNMRPIPRYEERTIFGDVHGKVGATELVLMTRPPGMMPATSTMPFEA